MAVQVVGQAGAPAKHLVLWLNVVGLLSAVRAQCNSANCNGCSMQALCTWAGCELWLGAWTGARCWSSADVPCTTQLSACTEGGGQDSDCCSTCTGNPGCNAGYVFGGQVVGLQVINAAFYQACSTTFCGNTCCIPQEWIQAVVCTQPASITGYTVTNTQLSVATGFDVTPQCA
eukprot:COSAG06_NODE_8845_length_2054_cov_171.630691_4_plen_173_part_01